MTHEDAAKSPPWLGAVRIGIGLAQGLAFYWLHRAENDGGWPSTAPSMFGALAVIFAFVPLIFIGGLGALRRVTLGGWALGATLVLGWMGWHDAARVRLDYNANVNIWPDWTTFWAASIIVFIGHHLVAAGDEARRWIAPYERYFDLGWRHAAQLVLSCAFTGGLWLLLYLGAALFKVVNVTFLEELIKKDWFYYPVTGMAFAAAIHLTDLRAVLVRGFRSLSLMLLSWLLPIMTVLGGAFLCLLPFTGLKPLWDTHAAGAILLSAAANLIILINAAYQDGGADTSKSTVLRLGARVAGVLLPPLVVLAGVALFLRIEQHGLSPERVRALVLILIGIAYASFYAVASFWKPWMKLIERGNIAAAYLVIAVLIAIFTPIADPLRLSVADQVHRLRSGAVSAADFDYAFLRFDAGKYGIEALTKLRADTSTEQAREISGRAAAVFAFENKWEAQRATREAAAENLDYPPTRDEDAIKFDLIQGSPPLPETFVTESRGIYASVFNNCRRSLGCDAMALNLDGDPDFEVIVRSGDRVTAFDRLDGTWTEVGSSFLCPGQERADVRAGQVTVTPPLYNDVTVAGARLAFQREDIARCAMQRLQNAQ